MSQVIPISVVEDAAVAQGIHALACIRLPQTLDPAPLQAMLAEGLGDMHWLAEQLPMRCHPASLLPGADKAIVAILPYQSQPVEGTDAGLRCARYAAGKDYHRIFRGKLARVAKNLQALAPDSLMRACVDSAPINERTLACQAALGWIGRNGLLINRHGGSYCFIGILLTNAPIETFVGPTPLGNCGSCHACERICPTAALQEGRALSTRCISYYTIEHQGVIPGDMGLRFQGWWYGCDICQECCPWNRRPLPLHEQRLAGSQQDSQLLALSEQDFAEFFAGRPQRRLGWLRFQRNLLVALYSIGAVDEAASLLARSPSPLLQAQVQALQAAIRDQGSTGCTPEDRR